MHLFRKKIEFRQALQRLTENVFSTKCNFPVSSSIFKDVLTELKAPRCKRTHVSFVKDTNFLNVKRHSFIRYVRYKRSHKIEKKKKALNINIICFSFCTTKMSLAIKWLIVL